MSPTDPKQFWEKKILGWETGRYYAASGEARGLLEKIGDWSSRSLRFRIQVALDLMRPHVRGKRVLELGCGSGLLARGFIEAGATEYLGIDIAESAIAGANGRKAAEGWGDNVQFRVDTVRDMPAISHDVVFSLGLLDWLNDDELDILFEKQGRADFLHAIAERRRSVQQWLHRNYVHVCYGWKTQGYVPRYFSVPEITQRAARWRSGPFHVYRDPRLSFGALISTCPIGPSEPAA